MFDGPLPLKHLIRAMSDEEIRVAFCQWRWPETAGEPVCPHCGALRPYQRIVRRNFKCRACQRDFSLVSRTHLASAKMPLRRYLLAARAIADGGSYRSLEREIGCTDHAAQYLGQRLREMQNASDNAQG